MAYNSMFPVTYPQYYPQYPQPQQNTTPNQPAQANNSIIWVQGEAGAKSYLVAPNTTVQLWDSEDQVIYLKSADASGMPSMKVLEYKIREAGNNQNTIPVLTESPNFDSFVTKDELHTLEEKIQKRLDKIAYKTKRVVEEVDEDE